MGIIIMAAPKYKLTYFDARGRGECPRWILLQGGVDFEDVRLDMDQWLELKPKTILGFIPQLECSEWTVAQVGVIVRVAARLGGLDGNSHEEREKAGMVWECARDLHNDWYRWGFEKNQELSKSIKADWMERIFPNFCQRMTGFLEQNGGKFFVGNGLTFADLAVACILDHLMNIKMPEMPEVKRALDDKHKLLADHYAMVTSLPKIKSHISTRKDTPL